MITEDYVSFELAKLLKEKGFDEDTTAVYIGDKLLIKGNNTIHNCTDILIIPAPTLQMAMKWLREKHIIISIHPNGFDGNGECHWYKTNIWADDNYQHTFDKNENIEKETYESACEDAIKWCLTNLI